MTPQSGPRPSDRWIPWYIVLFFVAQFGVFGWFYHVASISYTGVVTDQAYEKGLQYNQTIAKAETQERLGWSSTLVKSGGGIQFELRDRDKNPLSGAKVFVWLIRPVHSGIDQNFEMKETVAGAYYATVAVPEKGLWEVRIEVRKDGHTYQAAKRMEF